jgi:hypothetical protein
MSTPETAAETLAQFDRMWAELDATVNGLSEQALTEVHDPAGWSAKDHLMHVAQWEQALLAKVDGRPRHEALGIDAATDRTGDDDTINAAIFAATRHRPLKEVLGTLRETHAATRARLVAAVTLLSEVPGYADHYAQHRGWISELVTSAGRRA